MAKRLVCYGCLAGLLFLAGCGGGSGANIIKGTATSEPDHVSVQHILVGFEGSVPGKDVTRSREEASRLANELYTRAKAGDDFDKLVEEYTDDRVPGIYDLANNGITADTSRLEYPRSKMARAFGDVAFSLKVGEVGLTYYDASDSPFGYHVIKRVK